MKCMLLSVVFEDDLGRHKFWSDIDERQLLKRRSKKAHFT